jgi:stage II sporulation protein D
MVGRFALLLCLPIALAACQTTKGGKKKKAPPPPAPVAAAPAPAAPEPKKKKKSDKGAANAQVSAAKPSGGDPSVGLMPFPPAERDAEGRDLIRVKVFPHAKGDLRTGLAENTGEITIAGTCVELAGRPDRAGGTTRKLSEGSRFTYKKDALKKPVWLACDGGALVDRGEAFTNNKYLGSFYVQRTDKGVEVINVVPMETYLRGVVPTEVIPSWPEDTLKAQAIAARTYAYYNIAFGLDSKNAKFFDVDDTAFFQAYSGLTAVTPATDKAVSDTAGAVLSFQGKAVLTFFNTDAGGFTESAEEVFSIKAPYLKAKKEAHDITKTKSQWSVSAKLTEASDKLEKALPTGRRLKALTVEKADVTKSGRVRAVTATLDDGKKHRIEAPEFKKAFHLKSSLFTISPEGASGVKLSGAGSGHGVGMSQKGAKELVVQNQWDYKKILAFYYDGTALCSLVKGAPHGLAPCVGAGVAGEVPRGDEEERPGVAALPLPLRPERTTARADLAF